MLDNLEFMYYNSKASSREQAKQTACTECMTWDLSSAGRASALQAEGQHTVHTRGVVGSNPSLATNLKRVQAAA